MNKNNNKMDPAIFSVAFSILVFGVGIGVSLDGLCSKYYFEKMQESLQNGIHRLVEKDEEIDQLTVENNKLRKYLFEVQKNVNSALRISIPPPNSPMYRSSQCLDDDEEFELDLPLESPHIKTE